jgi:hypothetical protein
MLVSPPDGACFYAVVFVMIRPNHCCVGTVSLLLQQDSLPTAVAPSVCFFDTSMKLSDFRTPARMACEAYYGSRTRFFTGSRREMREEKNEDIAMDTPNSRGGEPGRCAVANRFPGVGTGYANREPQR